MAEYVSGHLAGFADGAKNRKMALFLDFDGTVSRIVEDPSAAVILPEAKVLIERIVDSKRARAAIVSGRALDDIKSRTGIPGAVYVGNHGQEISGPDIEIKAEIPGDFLEAVREIGALMPKLGQKFPGLFVEEKGAGISIHYRAVPSEKLGLLLEDLRRLLLPYIVANKIKTRPGKMVLDVKPVNSLDKGAAVNTLLGLWYRDLGHENPVIVYIGDDETDEDAFKALPDSALTFKVGGGGKTNAKYFVNSENEVIALLSALASALEERS